MAVLFALWYRVERTVSIHAIDTRRREWFYWAAILVTFALGTALGDLLSQAPEHGRTGLVFRYQQQLQ